MLLALYYSISEFLPDLPERGDVVWVGFALSALAFAPVMLVLRLRRARLLALVALGFAAIAVVLYLIGAELDASLPKLAAAVLVGFIFLRYFEKLSWVVILALLIPVTDTLSVWRGPTHYVVTEKPQIFERQLRRLPRPGRTGHHAALDGAVHNECLGLAHLPPRRGRTRAAAHSRSLLPPG